MRVAVQSDAFDVGAELSGFTSGVTGAGAVVSFTGLVRDEGGALSGMEIEHYPGMTEKAIRDIAEEAVRRWALVDALVIHRHGKLGPGEAIMMVATAAPHRGDAFAAAEYL
ncbi:MAG: molybdenum cofactor biosynthesis protein MoaE, partial [Acetobacteraceae bacterium]